jgi:hypothetical protein
VNSRSEGAEFRKKELEQQGEYIAKKQKKNKTTAL